MGERGGGGFAPGRAPSRLGLIAAGGIGIVGLYLVAIIALQPDRYQWDFRVYFYAALAHSAGVDPYDPAAVQAFAPAAPLLPFVYPPLLLYVFALFAALPYGAAYLIWLGIKVLALWGLILLWWRELFRDHGALPYAALLLLGFCSTIYLDLVTGNTSLIEQALLWSGLVLYLKKQSVGFVICIVLASSFKLLPVVFLALLLFDEERRSRRYLIAGVAAFVSLLGLSYAMAPRLFAGFVRQAGQIDERGIDGNASLLALIRDLSELVIPGRFEGLRALLPLGLYAAAVIALIWILTRELRLRSRSGRPDQRLEGVLLFCTSYALVAPRFKIYSFILLVPVAFHVLTRSERLPARLLLLGLLLIPLYPPMPTILPIHSFGKLIWQYYPLILAGMLWALLMQERQGKPGMASLESVAEGH